MLIVFNMHDDQSILKLRSLIFLFKFQINASTIQIIIGEL
jgi:hypothetical protein